MGLGIGIRDQGSEIRDPEKTYSGSRIQGQKGIGSRVPDPDPQHWLKVNDVRFVGHPVSLEPSKGTYIFFPRYLFN